MVKAWLVALITIIIAIPAFLLGPIIWPPITNPVPSAAQLPFFIFLSAVEALLLGFGIAFIFIAAPKIQRVSSTKKTRTILAFLALLWLLVSWWPHDNLHMHNGLNFFGLLLIDYGFHSTIMLATLILVYYFIATLKELR